MEFNLSYQIYPEGEPTWGLKSGALDVEDVKEFIRLLKEEVKINPPVDTSCGEWEFDEKALLKFIDKLAGEKLK